MKPNTVIARMPIGYNDFGRDALTDLGVEKFDEIICEMLPNGVSWCGNELIAPIDFDDDSFDINEIINAAGDKMYTHFENPKYFVYD